MGPAAPRGAGQVEAVARVGFPEELALVLNTMQGPEGGPLPRSLPLQEFSDSAAC